MKKLLLNVCCAPCVLPIIDTWTREEELSLFFYGPNIYPEDEFFKRLEQVQKISTIYQKPLIVGEYEHHDWLNYLKSNLSEPLKSYQENGDRCLVCFRYRMEKTALYASKHGFVAFATTLSLSRFKDTNYINNCGKILAKEYNIYYLPFSHDPNQAYKLGLKLSKNYGIYRQKYCGCEFSL